jgi:hypothetical protein
MSTKELKKSILNNFLVLFKAKEFELIFYCTNNHFYKKTGSNGPVFFIESRFLELFLD